MTYALVAAGITDVSGQTTAILIVLMFGAGTDYCLLIVARFRDELRRTEDVGEAMARATERTGPAILSAGAIVIVAMLVLALADFNATREMGPILALGIAVMVVAGLTLLPAILATLGRRAFWPAIPRAQDAEPPVVDGLAPRRPRWSARGPRRRPRSSPRSCVVGRARQPRRPRAARRSPRPSARRPSPCWASSRSRERFIPGRAAPLNVVTDAGAAESVLTALTSGLTTPVQEMYAMAASVPAGGQGIGADALGGLPEARAVLGRRHRHDPRAAPPRPRGRRRTPVLIGGEVAEAYDTREALKRDTRLILPIGLVLDPADPDRAAARDRDAAVRDRDRDPVVRLRARRQLAHLHAPDGPAGSDRSLEQFAFIFLVALGVDYNVFLLARIREERAQHADTKGAVIAALERTGGVITSAGLVLAATFSVLMALPLESLFQVGFVVALGLLADTFLVRALLVPSLAVLLGERNWWPNVRPRLLSGTSAKDA